MPLPILMFIPSWVHFVDEPFFAKLLQSLEQGTWSNETSLPFAVVEDISSPTSSWRRTISRSAFRAHSLTFSLPRLMPSPTSTIFERRGYWTVFFRVSWLSFAAASAFAFSILAAFAFCQSWCLTNFLIELTRFSGSWAQLEHQTFDFICMDGVQWG